MISSVTISIKFTCDINNLFMVLYDSYYKYIIRPVLVARCYMLVIFEKAYENIIILTDLKSLMYCGHKEISLEFDIRCGNKLLSVIHQQCVIIQ